MFSLYSYIEIQACLSCLTLKYVTIQKLDNLEMPFHPAFKIELDNQETIMNKHVICKKFGFWFDSDHGNLKSVIPIGCDFPLDCIIEFDNMLSYSWKIILLIVLHVSHANVTQ